MKTPSLALLGIVAALLSSCYDVKPNADQVQSRQTEKLLSEANRQIGMPNITNFTERKLMKTILELRDEQGLETWTYIVDMHGVLHFLTKSIGYGLPYSVQFTNPESYTYSAARHGGGFNRDRLPQADPNGLFMPTGLSATWIIAATKSGPMPMYVEPEILVSPFPMETTQ